MSVESEGLNLTKKKFLPSQWNFPCACGMFSVLAFESFSKGTKEELIDNLIDAGVFCGLPGTREIVNKAKEDLPRDDIMREWLDLIENCAMKGVTP